MSQSKHQNGHPELIHRSKIKPHPDNPRWIAEENNRRLKASLKKFGLVGELVWNVKSGHLIAGHQRLNKMDAMEGNQDYELWVWVVEIDPTTEAELLVVLNNTSVQGDYDSVKLKKLLGLPNVNYENMGFSAADVFRMYGQSTAGMPEQAVSDLGDHLRQGQQIMDRESARVEERDDPDAHLVLVFRNNEEADEFVATVVRLRGLDPEKCLGQRIIDGRAVLDCLDGDDTVARSLLPSGSGVGKTSKAITFMFKTEEGKQEACEKLGLERKRFFGGDEFLAMIKIEEGTERPEHEV